MKASASHTLRVLILFLRIALGLNFFYLGFGVLFNAAMGRDVRAHSLGDLYSWLATVPAAGSGDWVHPFAQWAFLIIGVCLMIGLLTRVSSVVAIVLVLFSYLPSLSYTALSISQFVSGEVIVVICLLILIVSGAGNYLGLDSFIHFRAPRKDR